MSLYQEITNRIIEELKKGTVPWRKPWRSPMPKNIVSGKAYRGINVVVLRMAGFGSQYWATFQQINKLGGSVRKGERGTQVYFTNRLTVEDEETGEERQIAFLKQYKVFNLEQTAGIETPEDENANVLSPIDRCEEIVSQMPNPPCIEFDEVDRAFYRPSSDIVRMPILRPFRSAERFYSTMFHELVHSTGHPTRLARKSVVECSGFGTETYSQEELVAEVGASFLCGMTGIFDETVESSASYIDGWLKALKGDTKLVVIAAAQAQKAVDFICGANNQ